MTKQEAGPWTLFEYVGGPRDGEFQAGPSAVPVDAPAGYLLRSNPPHVSAMHGWEQAAVWAAREFEGERAYKYERLAWQGDPFVLPSVTGPEATDRVISQARRMEHALIAGEHHDAQLIAEAFRAHSMSPTDLIESILAPALRSIGTQWATGTLRIYVQQRASAIVHSLLGDYSAVSAQIAGPRAAVATLAGEHHSLPARMAAVALREDGWQVEEAVGPLPPEEFVASVVDLRLDLGVISTTVAGARDTATEVRAQLRDQGIPVLIGEPGRSLRELQRLARRVSLASIA